MKRSLAPAPTSSTSQHAQSNPSQPQQPQLPRFRQPQPNDNIYDQAKVLIRHPVRFGFYEGVAYQLAKVVDIQFDPSLNQSGPTTLNTNVPIPPTPTNPAASYRFTVQPITPWDIYDHSTIGTVDYIQVLGNQVFQFNPKQPPPHHFLPQDWFINSQRTQDEVFTPNPDIPIVYSLKPLDQHSSASSGFYFPATAAIIEDAPRLNPGLGRPHLQQQQLQQQQPQSKTQKDTFYVRFANTLVHIKMVQRNVYFKIKGEERFDKSDVVPTVILPGQPPSLDDIQSCAEWYSKRRDFEREVALHQKHLLAENAAQRGVGKDLYTMISQQTVQLGSRPNSIQNLNPQQQQQLSQQQQQQQHLLSQRQPPHTRQQPPSSVSNNPQSQQQQQQQQHLQRKSISTQTTSLHPHLHYLPNQFQLTSSQLHLIDPNFDRLDREKYYDTPTTAKELIQFFLPFSHPLYVQIAEQYKQSTDFRFSSDDPFYISTKSSLHQLLSAPLTKANTLDIASRHPLLQTRIETAPHVHRSMMEQFTAKSSAYSFAYQLSERYNSVLSRQLLAQIQTPGEPKKRGPPKKSNLNAPPQPQYPTYIDTASLSTHPNAVKYTFLYAPTRQAIESIAMLASNRTPHQTIQRYIDLTTQPLSSTIPSADPSKPNQTILDHVVTYFKDTYQCNSENDVATVPRMKPINDTAPGMTHWGLFNLTTVLKPFSQKTAILQPPALRAMLIDDISIGVWALNQHPSLYSRYLYNYALLSERQSTLQSEAQYTSALLQWWGTVFQWCQSQRYTIPQSQDYIKKNALPFFPHTLTPIALQHTPSYHSHAVYTLSNHPRVTSTIHYYLNLPTRSPNFNNVLADHASKPLLTPLSHYTQIKSEFPTDQIDASELYKQQPLTTTPYIVPVPMYHPIVPLPNLLTLLNIQRRAPWAFLGTQFDLIDREKQRQQFQTTASAPQQPQIQLQQQQQQQPTTLVQNYKEVYRFRNPYNPVDCFTKLPASRIDKFVYSDADVDSYDYTFDY